jgi:hypothetical protein
VAPDPLLGRRIERFVAAGAPRGAAIILAAQIEIPEDDAVELLECGVPARSVLELLLDRAGTKSREPR